MQLPASRECRITFATDPDPKLRILNANCLDIIRAIVARKRAVIFGESHNNLRIRLA